MKRLLVMAFVLAHASIVLAQGPARPTPAQLTAAVHRLVDPHADAQVCRAPAVRGNEIVYECATTECPGGCQVVHRITVIAFRGGRFRRVSERREHRGDTGECGCCLDEL